MAEQKGTPYIFNCATEKWTQISKDVAESKDCKKRVCWVKDGDAPPYLTEKSCNSSCVVTFHESKKRANDYLMGLFLGEKCDGGRVGEDKASKLIFNTEMLVPIKCKKDKNALTDPTKNHRYKVIYLRQIKSPITENNILQDVFVRRDVDDSKKKYKSEHKGYKQNENNIDFVPGKDKMYDPVACESMELCCEQDELDYYETVLLGYYIKDESERSAYRNKYFKPPRSSKKSSGSMGGKKCYNVDFICGEWLGNSEIDKQKACLNRRYGIRITV